MVHNIVKGYNIIKKKNVCYKSHTYFFLKIHFAAPLVDDFLKESKVWSMKPLLSENKN